VQKCRSAQVQECTSAEKPKSMLNAVKCVMRVAERYGGMNAMCNKWQ